MHQNGVVDYASKWGPQYGVMRNQEYPIGIQTNMIQFGWLVVLGLTALLDSISVYIGPSPKEGVVGWRDGAGLTSSAGASY